MVGVLEQGALKRLFSTKVPPGNAEISVPPPNLQSRLPHRQRQRPQDCKCSYLCPFATYRPWLSIGAAFAMDPCPLEMDVTLVIWMSFSADLVLQNLSSH